MKFGEVQCPQCGNRLIDDGVQTITCPQCSTTFQRGAPVSAGVRANWPGWGLIATGVVGLLTNCLVGVVLMAMPRDAPMEPPAHMSEEEAAGFRAGQAAAPMIDMCCVALPTLAIYPLVIFSGFIMRSRRFYIMAIVGSVLAMAPCSLGFFAGLPCGIWALVTLLDPDVRDSFQ